MRASNGSSRRSARTTTLPDEGGRVAGLFAFLHDHGSRQVIERLCVVGVGLIGGSLARDLRALGLVGEVVGTSRRESSLARSLALQVIDRYELDLSRAVAGADLVVVAVPMGAMAAVLRGMSRHLGSGTVITDVGSAKQSVIADATRVLGPALARFVPGHPIAGTEHSGVEASQTGLFRARRVIITPPSGVDPEACARVRAMWQAVGAEVLEMDARHHDQVLAATSHLPHLLAYALMDLLGRMSERVEIFRYAAGGLHDFTRIASSDPQMWHDVCLANRAALLDVLDRFGTELHSVTEAVREKDGEALRTLFRRAKTLRDTYVAEAKVRSGESVDDG